MSAKDYKIYVDLDGTLVDFMTGAVQAINDSIKKVSNNLSYYKEEHPKFYKAVSKAVIELGGDLELGVLGEPSTSEYVAKTTPKKKVRNLMYAVVANNYDFWVNLDWMSDGKKLWNFISKHNTEVLSAPMREKSKLGKYDWCQKNLGLSAGKVTLTHDKQLKVVEAIEQGYTPILIDDMEKYITPFREAGGVAIRHTDASSTIKELKKLGFK